jgi:hypothetical protein
MLLSYETSSISYDKIDLIHGKFIPAKHRSLRCEECSDGSVPPIRVFINIYGVFANLSGRFAEKYDNLRLPCVEDCIIDYEYIRDNIPRAGVAAIMEEEGFWRHMDAYQWHMLLMGEIYKMCAGQYYFLLPLYDSLQLEDRLIWVWRHFGNVAKDRTMLLTCPSAQLLIKSRNDLFIGSNLKNCEDWSLAGGSAYWWPEIDANCKEPAKFLSKRIRLLSQAVAGLRELSKK